MKFYTASGDKGETSLMHGKKVSKDDERIECLGDLDELSSFIGLAVHHSKGEIRHTLLEIQRNLYLMSAEIADPTSKTKLLKEEHLIELEKKIDHLSSNLPPLKHFIVPGGSLLSSYLHVCRAICRRAERSLVKLSKKEPVNELLLKYANRLSSFLFVLALFINKMEGYKEVELKLNG